MGESDAGSLIEPKKEQKLSWYSGTGKGGQHRNKSQTSVRLTDESTGITTTAQTRSRKASLKAASEELNRRIEELKEASERDRLKKNKREQVGIGADLPRARVYRFKEDSVKDYNTGKTATCRDIMNGKFNLLW